MIPSRLLFIAALVGIGASSLSAVEGLSVHTFRKIQVSDQYYAEGASLGDLNGDGKSDVVAGPFWYAGPDFKTKHSYRPAKVGDTNGYVLEDFFSWVHDFNGDSKNDILTIGFPGTEAIVYLNPGKPGDSTNHWKGHAILGPIDNESPALWNLVGDPAPEILSMANGFIGFGKIDTEGSLGKWKFTNISPKGDWQRFSHGLGAGDVNGDGRVDILEKDAWWEQPADLSQAPWKKHPHPFSGGGAQMYAYDIDGDGDSDVVTSLAAHGFGLAWYEQIKSPSGGIDFKQHLIMAPDGKENSYGVKFSQLHALQLADMNGDGIQDLITGKCWWAHGPKTDPEASFPAVLYWFELTRRPGGGVDFIPHLIDDNSGTGRQISVGDLDGNKGVDIVTSNKKGTFIILHDIR